MNFHSGPSRKWLARFAWALLLFNIPVILWGAYVRVSFSGDGCGAHWPFCNGYVVPQHMAKPMLIEFTHRMMTSVDVAGAVLLCVWAFLAFVKGHPVRRYALISLFFLFVEALLGAGLVLFRKVAHDQSAGRAIYLSAHLTNTMLLLGALAVTAWLAQNQSLRFRWQNVSRTFSLALAITIVISITGSIASLGDMLFPASSLAAGFQQDFSASSHFLLRLRLFHPVLAVLGAAYLIWASLPALRCEEGSPMRKAGARVMAVVLLQILVGVMNLTFLAPIWLQMIHLLLADVLWIAVVLTVLESAAVSTSQSEADAADRPLHRITASIASS